MLPERLTLRHRTLPPNLYVEGARLACGPLEDMSRNGNPFLARTSEDSPTLRASLATGESAHSCWRAAPPSNVPAGTPVRSLTPLFSGGRWSFSSPQPRAPRSVTSDILVLYYAPLSFLSHVGSNGPDGPLAYWPTFFSGALRAPIPILANTPASSRRGYAPAERTSLAEPHQIMCSAADLWPSLPRPTTGQSRSSSRSSVHWTIKCQGKQRLHRLAARGNSVSCGNSRTIRIGDTDANPYRYGLDDTDWRFRYGCQSVSYGRVTGTLT